MAASFVMLFCIVSVIVFGYIYKKGIFYWVYYDVARSIRNLFLPRNRKVTHIIFAFVDHFEPGNRNADPEKQSARVDAWVYGYPQLADRHKDSNNIPPQHTFFFPPHYDQYGHLEKLVEICARGYGEIEMHLHHDRQEPWPETEETLRKKILDCLDSFSRCGVFCRSDGKKSYAFIHGDWALANSRKGGAHCGVNDEISILQDTGCYADFTFPVSNESQPKFANNFFYGGSCKESPKSYNRIAQSVSVGKASGKGLMFVQGILGIRWSSRTHRFKPSIEQSNIDVADFPFPARIDYWVNKRIHVNGRPDWLFIKIHTHGAREEDRDVLLGENADAMFSYLESKYNDKKRYLLHYVSAREMFNIIKAAEDGKNGNPHFYRDYVIPRYVYLPQRFDSGEQ